MATWLNRVVLQSAGTGSTTETYDPNAGTVVSGTAFVPTVGRLLVAIIGGPVTSTTPSGWTLPTSGSAINNNGLYVWWKVAAGSDTAVSTHNGDGTYPTIIEFLEFPAGSTFVGSNAAPIIANGASGPTLSGLTGTNLIMGASAYPGGQAAAQTWTPGTIDTYAYKDNGSGKYVEFGTAYLEDSVLTSSSMATTRGTGASSSYERLQFAINVAAGVAPSYPFTLLMEPMNRK